MEQLILINGTKKTKTKKNYKRVGLMHPR